MRKHALALTVFTLSGALLAGCAKSPEEIELKKSGDKVEIVLEGLIEPVTEAKIVAPVSQKIVSVYVKNGTRVTRGQTLLDFDAFELKHAYQKTVADYEKAKIAARYETPVRTDNQDALANAKDKVRKTFELYQNGNASLYELKSAEDAYQSVVRASRNERISYNKERYQVSKSIDEASKDVDKTELDVKKAKKEYTDARQTAAIAGFITDLKAYPGQAVAKGDVVGKIIDIDKVTLKGAFSPGIYPYLRKGMSLEVNCLTTPPYKTKGVIREISPVVDSETKRMRFDIPLQNKNYLMQPGDKCVISIVLAKKEIEAAGIVTDDAKVFQKSGIK